MKMYLSREFRFDAAHNLVNYKGKCENLHGHTYKLKITLTGEPDKENGMVLDFVVLKIIVQEKVLNRLDHTYPNDIIKQSTAYNMAQWIWDELVGALKGENFALHELTLWETESSSVTLTSEN